MFYKMQFQCKVKTKYFSIPDSRKTPSMVFPFQGIRAE